MPNTELTTHGVNGMNEGQTEKLLSTLIDVKIFLFFGMKQNIQ